MGSWGSLTSWGRLGSVSGPKYKHLCRRQQAHSQRKPCFSVLGSNKLWGDCTFWQVAFQAPWVRALWGNMSCFLVLLREPKNQFSPVSLNVINLLSLGGGASKWVKFLSLPEMFCANTELWVYCLAKSSLLMCPLSLQLDLKFLEGRTSSLHPSTPVPTQSQEHSKYSINVS